MLKSAFFRKIFPIIFIALALFGAYFEIGWGTFSSFGYKEIAAICPLGALETMLASRSVLLPALVALILFFLLAVIGGRFFCGWICPISWTRALFGLDKCKGCAKREKMPSKKGRYENGSTRAVATQANEVSSSGKPNQSVPVKSLEKRNLEAKFFSQNEAEIQARKSSVSKTPYWVLGGTLLSSAVFGFPVFCLICPVGLFFAALFGIWHLFVFKDPSWSLFFFLGMLVIEMLVLRRWCHQFCPIGALFSLMSRANSFFRPNVDQSACYTASKGLSCRLCQKVCPENLWMGKGLNKEEASRCTKCQRCAEICPGQAISFPFSSLKKPISKSFRMERLEPEKVQAEVRKANFHEIYKPFTLQQAQQQAARCMECGACEAACPQHNPIVARLHALRQGDVRSAARSTLTTGSLPEVCGRVCPQNRLCESVCPLAEAGGAVPIGALSRFIADEGLRKGWNLSTRKASSKNKSVAIVGSGPAGLACADLLNQAGFRVTVFEKEAGIGGLMMWGIPSFKLEKELLSARLSQYKRQGICFKLNHEVGHDSPWKSLLSEFDAVFVGTGSQDGVRIGSPIDKAVNVVQALSFLKESIVPIVQSKNTLWTEEYLQGKKVIVLGGGDTAVDCARVAVRQKAESVRLICRKPRAHMRAQASELFSALEEGVEITDAAIVESWDLEEDLVKGVWIKRSGASTAQYVPTDLVIVAYGFSYSKNLELEALGVQWNLAGFPITENYQSKEPKLFFGGDCRHGADLVVTAIADGKGAALAMQDYLNKKSR